MESLKQTSLAKRCVPMLLATLLASCATMTASGGIETLPVELRQAPFCRAAKGISWSSKDTAQTVLEIKEHNAVGATLCGWKAGT